MPSKTYIDEDGYWRFKDSNIPVHRWAAEKKLGRELRPGEVVNQRSAESEKYSVNQRETIFGIQV